jgi:hypothetical protein
MLGADGVDGLIALCGRSLHAATSRYSPAGGSVLRVRGAAAARARAVKMLADVRSC